MDYYKKKLIHKLKAQSSEVQDELSDVESIFDRATPLFCEAVHSFCSNSSRQNPLEDLKDESTEDKDVITDGIKSIFRKIAVKTHPDKVDDVESSIDQYRDVTTAKKDQDVNKIISIAKDLKIDMNDISYSDIKIIENSIKKTQLKIEKIMNSYPWVWFYSNENKRVDIITEFVINKCNT